MSLFVIRALTKNGKRYFTEHNAFHPSIGNALIAHSDWAARNIMEHDLSQWVLIHNMTHTGDDTIYAVQVVPIEIKELA